VPETLAAEEISRLTAERDAALSERDAANAQRDAALTEFLEEVAARDEQLADFARRLRMTQEEVEYLRKRIFGRRSEKLPYGPTLFDLDGSQGDETPPVTGSPDDEGSTLTDRERKKSAPRRRGRKPLPEDLPRVRVEVPLADDERDCNACGKGRVRIGEDVSETLHYKPAHYEVRQIVRGRYACSCGDGGVVQPEAPARPIPGSYAGASVIADALVSKFADHLPLHRKAVILRRSGLDIARSTLCDWIAGAVRLLVHICDAIRVAVLASAYIQADETPVLVQSGAGGRPKKGQFFAYREVVGDQIFYDFRMSRSRDGPSDVLAEFSGTLQVDCYAGYEEVIAKRDLIVLHCVAHARRKFHETIESAPHEAAMVLVLFRRLYRIEAAAREKTPQERKEIRRVRSRPVLAQLARMLRRLRTTTSPGTRLGKAIAYMLGTRRTHKERLKGTERCKRWKRMTRFLLDGSYEIDSNSIERAMRGIAMGRRAWLFCGNEKGGQRAAVVYTLIENCRRAGVEPFAYLRDVLERLPTTPISQVAELTPQRWAAAQRAAATAD